MTNRPFTREDAIAAINRADTMIGTLRPTPGQMFESWYTLYLIVQQCLLDPACFTTQDALPLTQGTPHGQPPTERNPPCTTSPM